MDDTEALALLADLVRQACFLHVSYDEEEGQFHLVAVAAEGTRKAVLRGSLGEAIEVLAGREKAFRCSKCKHHKPASQFPPVYERIEGKSDGGRQYWCLDCKREASKVAMQKKRARERKLKIHRAD